MGMKSKVLKPKKKKVVVVDIKEKEMPGKSAKVMKGKC